MISKVHSKTKVRLSHTRKNVWEYLLTPIFTFSRVQFNLIGVFFISIGLITGIYLTLSHFWSKAFALNDTVTTWTFNSANANQFTYDNNLITVNNSGAFPGVNKLTNPNFDIDLAGWSEVPSYTLNDQFTTNRSAGAVNGTAAEPTGGTRTVVDTGSKMSIGSGVLSMTPNTAMGDPGLWYSSVNRTNGMFLVYTINTDLGQAEAGWTSSSQTNSGTGTLFFNNGTIYYKNVNTASYQSVGSYSSGTIYKVAITLRTNGSHYFIKGGAFTNWTMLMEDLRTNVTPLYPALMNRNATVTFDNIRIPTATWLPTPLAYSTFTTGGATSTETIGPDSQTTPSLTLTGGTVGSGVLSIIPTMGSEVLTNPGFEAPYSSGVANGWATVGAPTLSQETTIVHAGSSSQKVVAGASGNGVAQTPSLIVGRWYSLDSYVYSPGVISMNPLVFDGTAFPIDISKNTVANTWVNITGTGRAKGTGNYARMTFNGTPPQTYYVDDYSLKPLVLSSLFSTVSTSKTDLIVDANITSTYPTQAGVVVNLNDAATPTAGVVAYLTRTNTGTGASVTVDKFTAANTWTNVQAATTVTYSAGATLRVIKDGTKYKVYYNNALVGSELTISDAGIINNTIHGMFSTSSANTFDNFTLWARGNGAEYTDAPFEELTPTRDTGIKYAGAASVKLVASGVDANYLQSVNVGDTSTYNLVAYAYKGAGQAVTSSDLSLYYDTGIISTTFTSVGSDWYRLNATITGANASKSYGIRVKSGKTVYVDEVKLDRIGTYSVYTTAAYQNLTSNTWDTFCEGTLVGTTCTPDATHVAPSAIKYQLCTDDGSSCQSGNSWKYWNGSAWASATDTTTTVNSPAQLTNAAMTALPTGSHKLSVKAIFTYTGTEVPLLPHISVGLTTDTTPPVTNASATVMTRSNGGTNVASNSWTNNPSPYFSWNAGADNFGGVGLKGYCLYLGTDISGNPATAKGLLGTSPVDTTNTTCQFIVAATTIDFATASYKGSTWLTTSNSPYYLNIKAIDNVGNIYSSTEQYVFRYDDTRPTNVAFTSCASGNFSNVIDMNFNWPTTGSTTSSDGNSNVLGWQYQFNSTTGSWKGINTDATLTLDYIPTSNSSYTLDTNRDGGSIVSGNNVLYFRTVDNAGNPSSDATIRTCNLSYGGAAPTFGGSDVVTISPSSSVTNSYALSWPNATASGSQSVAGYYYMVNTPPPSTYATLVANSAAYIPNGTSTTVSTRVLPNVNKGSNTIYVVAVDDAGTPNYSPSNYISGLFTLNSTDPDNIANLIASDSSIKSQEQWNVTLTWTAPIYQGAGNLTYLIYRSSDGVNFSQVGSTSGLSYVDNAPSSSLFYYKVYTKDGANALSSGTNAVSITPTGRWTVAAELLSGPSVTRIGTKTATVVWSTSRGSDSKVQYGVKSGVYNPVELSNAAQVTSHSIKLKGLSPNTVYFYRAKWTDEDGNTGTSSEKMFITSPAPIVKDVQARNIGLNSAIIQFTSKAASKVKIYYGTTTSFGAVKVITTSNEGGSYTTELSGLLDGTKYYYQLNPIDAEGNEYQGSTLSFATLPRPRITDILIQQVVNTAQPTILVTWTSNTEVTSIVSYYPEGSSKRVKNAINLDLIKGEHKMIIRGLLAHTHYILTVKGQDKVGNEGISDTQRITTATDTRPPVISDLKIEGVASNSQESKTQLIVAWNTDEPSSGQVEFGEGAGSSYAQKTQEDTNLTVNHIVIISNLTPSKVYHLRAVSKDSSENIGNTIDTVVIAPRAIPNALSLVIFNLLGAFGLTSSFK